jgi:hypothetical protein
MTKTSHDCHHTLLAAAKSRSAKTVVGKERSGHLARWRDQGPTERLQLGRHTDAAWRPRQLPQDIPVLSARRSMPKVCLIREFAVLFRAP